MSQTVALHSELGASGMYRWSRCAGSFRLIQGAKSHGYQPRRSIYAARGTLAHKVIETEIREAIKRARAIRLTSVSEGDVIQQDAYAITVDQEFVHGVVVMLNYVERARRDYEFLRVETRVSLDAEFEAHTGGLPPVPLFATADVILVSFKRGVLEIVDYKNGVGVLVRVKDNPQLLYYAAGVMAFLHPDDRKQIHTVKITVVQPHASGAQPIRSQEIAAVDLDMWVDEELIPAVERCADPAAAFCSGAWCRFCPAAQFCPQLAEDANAMAKRDFADHMLPPTPQELAEQLAIAERAELWIDALRVYALEQAKAQVRIPGYSLEPTQARRQWIDHDKALNALVKAGVPPSACLKTELLSPAQFEKVAKKLNTSSDWWSANVAPLVEHRSSGVKLVRHSQGDPAEDFVLADEDNE